MKQLREQDLLQSTPLVMTKRDKLLRLAQIARHSTHSYFALFTGLEYVRSWASLREPYSIFEAAAADPVLRDAGLQSDTAGEAMRFFELTRNEMHSFCCGCGGGISNDEMARRIERLT
jgi:hypothetical protein